MPDIQQDVDLRIRILTHWPDATVAGAALAQVTAPPSSLCKTVGSDYAGPDQTFAASAGSAKKAAAIKTNPGRSNAEA
jgi:hypothetical protein